MTKRNLVILFDGTYNTLDKQANGEPALSNVYKVGKAMLFNGELLPEVNYVTGVGTCYMDEFEKTAAFGTDIPDRLKRGYDILSDWLGDGKCKPEENQIYLFGFSRGAYTARLFAHLMSQCGVPKNKMECDATVNTFINRDEKAGKALAEGRAWNMPVKALCVWDTVKASCLGDYEDEMLPDIVENAFHAMSMDENRGKFAIMKFKGNRAVQRWFPGVHSDVGGGYPESESDLSNISLKWMLENARFCGMKFKKSYVEGLTCRSDGKQHNEMNDFWKLAINGGEKYRDILDGNHPIDESVFKRKILVADYHPAGRDNLPGADLSRLV